MSSYQLHKATPRFEPTLAASKFPERPKPNAALVVSSLANQLQEIVKVEDYLSKDAFEGQDFDASSESWDLDVLLERVLHVDDVRDVGKGVQEWPK